MSGITSKLEDIHFSLEQAESGFSIFEEFVFLMKDCKPVKSLTKGKRYVLLID